MLNSIAAPFPYAGALLFALFLIAAASLCRLGEKIFGEKDSQKIVIDEIAGFLLATFQVPPTYKTLALAFLLFRFFDIMKVFPAALLERRENGVLLDDLVAGLYTLLILRVVLYWELL